MSENTEGAFFRRARKQLSLTQVEFAKLLEVDVRTIKRWEAGEHIPHNMRAVINLVQMDLLKKRR